MFYLSVIIFTELVGFYDRCIHPLNDPDTYVTIERSKFTADFD